eukprot:COSAG05_NODE_2157_length_3459_cov_2.428274_2_plen_464_part_00
MYSLVFGESVLNDAIAIVLYGAIDRLRSTDAEAAALAFSTFAIVFLGSLLVGIFIGMASALLLKHANTSRSDENFCTEQSLLLIFPFISWMLAEGVGLSGIVSILFCGMTMNYYTRHNLHKKTAVFNQQFFKVLASTCETFVFIYIGLGVCFFHHTYRWPLIFTSLAALFIARAANVYGISFILNKVSTAPQQPQPSQPSQPPLSPAATVSGSEPTTASNESKEVHTVGGVSAKGRGVSTSSPVMPPPLVPQAFQHMLCFSGLRGAIAFALALKARDAYSKRSDGSEGAGGAILTTTLVIILFSVLVLGGLTATVMEYLVPSSSPPHPPHRNRHSDGNLRLPTSDSFENDNNSSVYGASDSEDTDDGGGNGGTCRPSEMGSTVDRGPSGRPPRSAMHNLDDRLKGWLLIKSIRDDVSSGGDTGDEEMDHLTSLNDSTEVSLHTEGRPNRDNSMFSPRRDLSLG